jgi:hypothetical protein
VSAILDAGGEIAASVDDITAIEEHLTSAWIQRFEDVIAAAPIVLLDANLLPDAIWTACQSKREGWTPLRCFVSVSSQGCLPNQKRISNQKKDKQKTLFSMTAVRPWMWTVAWGG